VLLGLENLPGISRSDLLLWTENQAVASIFSTPRIRSIACRICGGVGWPV